MWGARVEPLSTFPDCRTSWNFLCRLWRQRDPSWDGTEGAASQTLGSPKEQLELETEFEQSEHSDEEAFLRN